MNRIDENTLLSAEREAAFNIYCYLAHKLTPSVGQTFAEIIAKYNTSALTDDDNYHLGILKNAVSRNKATASVRLIDFTLSDRGLNAFAFSDTYGNISVVFRGTGAGEWIDNGMGLSGIPNQNTYVSYSGSVTRITVSTDHATLQQVEALNWFCKAAHKNGWGSDCRITVSGHSKGGNKAQFITMHSEMIDRCISFDGQGFSPEAINELRLNTGSRFDARRKKIISISSLIIGAGPTGLCTLLCVMLKKPKKIIICEKDAERIHFVREHYPEVLTVSPNDLKKFIATECEHGGADIVLEVAGSDNSFRLAWECARPNGYRYGGGALR